MKSVSFLLVSLLSALGVGAPLAAENFSPLASGIAAVATTGYPFPLGSDEVEGVRADFNAGSYSEFLKKMDGDYQDAKKSNGLEGLIEIRKEGARAQIHPEFAHSFRVIQEVRNNQMLEAVQGDDSLFAQKVRSAASSQPTREERLISLYGKVPGSGTNSDENRLIDLDLEYYYKAVHLDAMTGLSVQDKKERHLALEMDKIARMLSASDTFEDKSLQAAVEKDACTLDARLARNCDMSDLNALSRGKIKPITEQEEKVAAVIAKAQGDLADLHRHLVDSLDESQIVQK